MPDAVVRPQTVFLLTLYEDTLSVHWTREGAREAAAIHQKELMELKLASPLDDYSVTEMKVEP